MNPYACPKCKDTKHVNWRHGLHFDHLLRCSKCEFSWDPDDLYQEYLEEEQERKLLCTDRD